MNEFDLALWLQGLRVRQQQVVVLHFMLDLNFNEIAEVLGCSRARIWQHWNAAQRALAAHQAAA